MDIFEGKASGVKNTEDNMKAVIFDMDGLMFNTERVFVDAWNYAGEKAGIGQKGTL